MRSVAVRLAWIALVVPGLLALSGEAAAQPSGCSFLPGGGDVRNVSSPSGAIVRMQRARLRCQDGRYMEADSVVFYEVSQYSNMFGNVVFRTDGRELRSENAQYFERLGRLEADGNVRLRDLNRGTVITGEDLLYLRAAPQRPQERLTVTGGRPTAVLYPRRDTLREPNAPSPDSVTPYQIVGDRIYLVGDQFLEAQGTVEVTRDSLQAFSDSLSYDQVGGLLNLSGRPARVLQGELDLVGLRMEIRLPGDVIEEVVATDEAVLHTDSLDVEAPFIRIFMLDGALDRLVAAVPGGTTPAATASDGAGPAQPGSARPAPGPEPAEGEEAEEAPRARAEGSNITMVADSIDVIAPNQRLERMVAVGRARAVSTARDTLNNEDTPETLLEDWIEGDTVRAVFAPVLSEADLEDSEYALESLEARLNARSLYRLDPDSTQRADTTAFRGRLPVNYTEADGILLYFDDGAVTEMEWVGLRRGIQLQPTRRPDDVARRAGGLHEDDS